MTRSSDAPPGGRIAVLAASTLGLSLGFSNVAFLGFGLYVLPLVARHGWSRTQIAFGFTVMTATIIIATPLVGRLIDRFGVRRVLLPSIPLFATSFASLALVDRLWQFYLAYVFIALFGAGTLAGTYGKALIGWFDRRRGLALGIAIAGIGVGGVIVPQLVHLLLDFGGLRAAYFGIAALTAATLPAIALFVRERPGATPPVRRALPLIREALFWRMAAAFLMLGVYTAGTLTTLIPLLVDRGIDATRAGWAMTLLAAALTLGRVGAGYLLDRFHPPAVVVGFLLLPIIGMGLLGAGATGEGAFAAAILLGLGMGAEFDFMSYLVSRYLPPDDFSRNYGATYASYSIGAAIGPPLFAASLQRAGSYDPALWFSVLLVVAATLIYARLGPPRFDGPIEKAPRNPISEVSASHPARKSAVGDDMCASDPG